MKTLFSTMLFFVIANFAVAQFAPPAGQLGSTALHKDSSIFVGWASNCTVQRGFQDISNPSLGLVSNGDSTSAIGKANAPNVLSLGDGGSATLTFATPIVNGQGWDFAVFENSFVDTFLELAFVEVSSDGINFHRFGATSNTQDSVQVGSFGRLDATKINNLAGKYIANYGTPFDLDELKNIAGLDVNNITHVRVIDVVGCITEPFASFDKNNHKINDPWRTDFITGGFDLDAVGVINTWPTAVASFEKKDLQFKVYPNPSTDGNFSISFVADANSEVVVEVFDMQGRVVLRKDFIGLKGKNSIPLSLSNVLKGNYNIHIAMSKKYASEKIIFY